MSLPKKIFANTGEPMLSARAAAKLLNCAPDYVGKLCREGKLVGQRIDNAWFVQEASIIKFQSDRRESKSLRAENLAGERRKENELYRKLNGLPGSLPKGKTKSAFSITRPLGLAIGTTFLLISVVFAGTVASPTGNRFFGIPAQSISNSQTLTAALAQIESPFFVTKPPLLAIPQISNPFTSNFFSNIFAYFFPSNNSINVAVSEPTSPQPSVPLTSSTESTSSPTATVNQTPTIVENITQPIIERTLVESSSPPVGITQADLTEQLTALSNSLTSLIYQNQSTPNSLPATGGYTNNIALAQNIGQLNNVTIAASTINNSSFNNASGDFTGTFTSTNTATSSFAAGINLGSGCFSINGVCIGSGSGTAVATGTPGLVQFTNGTTLAADSSFSFATSTKTLSAENFVLAGTLSLTAGGFGNCTLETNPSGSVICGTGGGGGSDGNWVFFNNSGLYLATTTNQVLIGSTATTSLAALEVNSSVPLSAYFKNAVGIGTTSPFATFAVNGSGFFTGNVTATNLTATGTLAVSGLSTLSTLLTTGSTTLQNFTAQNSTTTNATTTNLVTSTFSLSGNYFTSLLGTGLTDLSGALSVSTTSLGLLGSTSLSGASVVSYNPNTGVITTQPGTFGGAGAYTFPQDLIITGNSTTSQATTTTLFSTTASSTNLFASVVTLGSATINALTLGSLTGPLQAINGVVSATSTLSVAYGGTSSTTLGGLLSGNGTGALTSAVVSAPLSFSGNTLSISQAGSGSNGYLSSTDWNTFNNKISSTSLSGASVISYTSSTGVITTTPGTFGGAGAYTFPQDLGISSSTPFAFLSVNPTAGVASNEFDVGSSTATSFIINNSGNVGVGTTSPYALLSVGNTGGIGFTTGTSTFNTTGGINLASGGCFAIAGTCVSSSGSSGLTSIGPTGQTTTGPAVTLSTTTSTTNGITSALTITGSGSTLTFQPSQSGTLTVGGGGTGSTTLSSGEVLYGSGTGPVSAEATSSLAQASIISITNGSSAYVLGNQPTFTTQPGTFGGAGAYTFPQDLIITGNSTTSQATTTTLFSTTASSTNLFASVVTLGSATINALTLGSLTGPLQAINGVVSATSTLSVAYGGTSSTTLGGLLSGNGTGALTSAVVSAPLSFSGNTLSISQAGSGSNGYLSSTDWNTFNNKISSTSLSGASVISYTSSTGVITTTPGTFGGAGAYTFPQDLIITGNSTTSQATTSVLAVTGSASTSNLVVSSLGSFSSTCVQANAQGQLSATGAACGSGSGSVTSVSNSDGTLTFSPTTGLVVGSLNTAHANTFTALEQFNAGASSTLLSAYSAFFGATATSSFDKAGDLLVVGSTTLQNFTAVSATTSQATTTNLALTSLSSALLFANANGSVISTTTLATNFGGTGSTTLGGLLTGNGTGALTSAVVSSPLSFSGNTLSISEAGSASNGYLSSTDWNTFNNKLSSSSLAVSADLASLISDGTGTGSVVFGTGATLSSTTLLGSTTLQNATSTNLAVANNLVANGNLQLSTFGNGCYLLTNAAGIVTCGSVSNSNADLNWTYFNGSGIRESTTTNQVLIGASATSSLAQLQVVGGEVVDAATSTTLYVSSTLTTGGDVGIGTTTPTAALAIAGGDIIHTAFGNPSLATSVPIGSGGTSYKSYVSGDYLYEADDAGGLRIFDISNPKNPVQVGTYTDTGSSAVLDVVVAGKYAYIADAGSSVDGVGILDVSNPALPTLIGTYTIAGSGLVYSLALSGKYLYATDYNNHALRIIDVSNPQNPTLAGSYSGGSGSFPYAVAVAGRYAYIGDYSSPAAVYAVDISNPQNPTKVGTSYTSNVSAPTGLYVSGRYLYVADTGGEGMYILNISNPASLALVGAYNPSSNKSYNDVEVAGNYAYIADNADNLIVVDTSNPASPVLIGTYALGGTGNNVTLAGKYAYVGAGSAGIKIIDINGLQTPAATIGSLAANNLNVSDSVNIGGDVYAGGGLDVGISGIFSRGTIAAFIASTTQSNPVVASFIGGNVGIGTTSPFTTLSVNGSGFFGGNVTASNITATGTLQALNILATGSTTLQNFTAVNATTSQATTTNLALTSLSSALLYANGQGSIIGTSTLAVNVGGTGSTTLGGLLTGNGTGAVTSASVSAPLSFSGTTLSISQAGASSNGYLSSTDWNTFNNKISSTSLSGTFPIAYNSSTGAITFSGLSTSTNLTAGNVPYVTGVNTFGQVATTTQTFSGPFTLSAVQGALVGGNNATITWTGLATTTALTAGEVLYSNGTSGVTNEATGTIAAGSGISLGGVTTGYDLGSGLTITNTGLLSYDAFSHPLSYVSATTSEIFVGTTTTNNVNAALSVTATTTEANITPLFQVASSSGTIVFSINATGATTTNFAITGGAANCGGTSALTTAADGAVTCTAQPQGTVTSITNGGGLDFTQSPLTSCWYHHRSARDLKRPDNQPACLLHQCGDSVEREFRGHHHPNILGTLHPLRSSRSIGGRQQCDDHLDRPCHDHRPYRRRGVVFKRHKRRDQ